MEKLSRVKKYEELRRHIDNDTLDEIVNEQNETKSNMHDFDPVLFKQMTIQEEHRPTHEKTMVKSHESFNTDTFKNEYMDDFIREVKQYNMQKGLLECENTEIDILHQLKAPLTRKREHYIKDLNEEKNETVTDMNENTIQSKQEIARQIQELLNDDKKENSGISVKKVDMNEVKEASKDTEEVTIMPIHAVKSEESREFQRKLAEETQQIRVQMNRQEEEITGLNDGIDRTHRLLKIVLFLLLVALIAVIGVMVYWVVQASK